MKCVIGVLPVVVACTLLMPIASPAGGEQYASWKAFEAAHPHVGTDQAVPSFDGDLNEDGIKDKVVMLYLPDHDHSQIFVLTGDRSGAFNVTGQSDAFEYGTGGAGGFSWVQPIEKYAKNAFAVTFVTDDNAISSCTYKFRLRGKTWRLAGEDCDSEGEGDNLYDWQSSVDFLTGRYTSHLSDANGRLLKERHGVHHFPVLTLRDFKYGDDHGLDDLWIDVP